MWFRVEGFRRLVNDMELRVYSRCHAAAGDEVGTGKRGGGADEDSDSDDDDDILCVPNLG